MQAVIDLVSQPTWWAFIAALGMTVVGVMEWLKNCPLWKDKAPTWIWWLLMPFICTGVAIVANGGILAIALNALATTALCEFSYAKLLKKAKAIVPDTPESKP